MSAARDAIRIGTELVSAPYLLDAAAAKAYHDGIEGPPRRRPPRGIHDDKDAARKAGFVGADCRRRADDRDNRAIPRRPLRPALRSRRTYRSSRSPGRCCSATRLTSHAKIVSVDTECESRRAADSCRESARRTGADWHRRSQDRRRMSAGTIPDSSDAPRDEVPAARATPLLAQGDSVSRHRRDLRADLLAHPDSQSRTGAVAGADTRFPGGVHAVLAVLLRDRFGVPDLGRAPLQRADALSRHPADSREHVRAGADQHQPRAGRRRVLSASQSRRSASWARSARCCSSRCSKFISSFCSRRSE